MAAAMPVVEHMSAWNSEFVAGWSPELAYSQQARALDMLGGRVAIACSAAAQFRNVPLEALGFDALLRDTARVRHAWVDAAANGLKCCDNAVSPDIDTGNTNTSAMVSSLLTSAESLIDEYDVTVPSMQWLIDPALGIEIAGEEGWMISADGISPVLHAPAAMNRRDVTGLGPERWQLGTAVRVRRLRNPESMTTEEASSRFNALVTQQGSVGSVAEVAVSGITALRHNLSPELESWSASVTVFVDGEFTYFIETGCPTEVARACESTTAVASSLTVLK